MEDSVDIKIPTGWSELSWKQLVEVWRLHGATAGNRCRFHVAVFLYLAGLPALERWSMVDGILLTRWRDGHGCRRWWRRAKTLRLSLPELEDFAFGRLAWLDEPYALPALPSEFVRVGGRRYKLPAANLLNFTWQQYNNLQRIMQGLWSLEMRLEKLMRTPLPSDETEAQRVVAEVTEKVNDIEGKILDLRAQFLAHALLPPALALTDIKDRTTRWHPHRVFQYDVGVAQLHRRYLRKAPSWLFAIVYQTVQSSLGFYSKQFPELFKSSGSGPKKRNEMIAETGTINAVMKYNGYRDQQDVYDSNAVFVFEILSTMTKEADEVKKMNRKKH